MRLLDVELRRALSRRAVRGLIGLCMLGIVIGAVIAFFVSKPAFDQASALSRATAARQADMTRCTSGSDGPTPPPGMDRTEYCDQFFPPVSQYVSDKRFHMERLWGPRDPVLAGLSPILLIGALIAGATALGAEWRHGTIATLLTWEPRRLRVMAAKLVAVALAAFVIGVLLQAFLVLALFPAGVARGTTDGMTAVWWRGLTGGVLRIGLMTSAAAVFSACVASVGRNTAAAIGVAFGYLIVVENAVRGLRPQWQRWLVGNNGATLVLGKKVQIAHAKGMMGASVILGVYLAVIVAVAVTSFVRRDVT